MSTLDPSIDRTIRYIRRLTSVIIENQRGQQS